jgi:predicted DNA-binding protein (MmcQ/YjbR family)
MNTEEIREHCMRKKGVEESFPFDNNTLVFKVGGKIFLLLSLDSDPVQFNAKCDPDKAIELRENHTNVLPGYHMNKKHWNTIICNGTVSKRLLMEWIDHSYELVVDSLPQKTRKTTGL